MVRGEWVSTDTELSGGEQNRRQIENTRDVARQQTGLSEEELDEILDARKMT